MYQKSPRDQFVFGSAMLAKPIDSKCLGKFSNKSFELLCVTTIFDRNNTTVQAATEIFCQPHQQVSNKSHDLHDKLPLWKLKQFNVAPHPQDPVLSCSSIYKIYCISTTLSYHISTLWLEMAHAHTQRVAYLGTAAGVKSVRSAARIKKYNLICVLLPHWMAAGCSPIKIGDKVILFQRRIELSWL